MSEINQQHSTDDLEIGMHAFRLMRSGNFTKANALMKALALDFPERSPEELRRVMARLCSKLLDAA